MGSPVSTTGTMGRLGRNFTDEPCWTLELDFDGSGVGRRNADSTGRRTSTTTRPWLRKPSNDCQRPFRDAECICYATSSTGLPVQRQGRACSPTAAPRFSLIFWTSAQPTTLALQLRIVRALKKLPGLECLDAGAYSLAHFFFIARPVFPKGMADPIVKPVRFHRAKRAQVDLNEKLLSEIDIGEEDAPENKPRGAQGPGDRALVVDPELEIDPGQAGGRGDPQQSRPR